MTIAQAKILLRRTIAGAYPELNIERKRRYNQRQRSAEGACLNFRLHDRIIASHGIRRFLQASNYQLGAHGLCAVCGKESQICICKIVVHDQSGAVIREM